MSRVSQTERGERAIVKKIETATEKDVQDPVVTTNETTVA